MAPADFLSAIQQALPLFKGSKCIRHPTSGEVYVTVPHFGSQCQDKKPVAVRYIKFFESVEYLLARVSQARIR